MRTLIYVSSEYVRAPASSFCATGTLPQTIIQLNPREMLLNGGLSNASAPSTRSVPSRFCSDRRKGAAIADIALMLQRNPTDLP